MFIIIKVKNDLTGQTFGMLTIICQDEDFVSSSGIHRPMWLCQCACGREDLVSIRGDSITSGHTRSCGCLQKENAYNIGKENQKYNKKDLSGEYGIIWSTNTNEEIYFDLEDAEKILQYNWYVNDYGYAFAHINRKKISMHSFLGCSNYDHHNRNKLDNRKKNLIPCTCQENARNGSVRSINTSGFIGVSQRKDTKRWEAFITVDRKRIHLGYFMNKEDAIKVRLEAEAKYFGDFAPQRHLFEEYNIESSQLLDNTKLV